MTMFSGAFDKEVFDGNTILLKIGEENGKHKYVYIGGDMVCSFTTTDMNIPRKWEIIYVLIVWLQVEKITIC